MPRTRSSPFDVTVRCRVCGHDHHVRGTAELLRQPITFGGGASTAQATTSAWAGPVTCPREQRSFEGELRIPCDYNESVRGVQIASVTDEHADGAAPAAATEPAEPPGDWVDEELKEWRRTTVATQRTYATTMLTTSSGGVAVYFAVLKYLGWEQADLGTSLVVLSIAPPVLFFAAAGSFALALRPSLTFVERSEYAEFRARRVGQMHRRASIGTAFYAAALLLAVVTFVLVLERAS
jgi:hypothetical protein